MGWLILLSIFVLLVLNVPVGFCLGIASIMVILVSGAGTLNAAPHLIYSGLNSYALLAIPLFILAGDIMNTGGITQRLVDFSKCLVGHLRGGLAFVTIVAGMIMAGVSGSAVADTAALGAILIPAMVLSGIDKSYAAALVALSGTIGIIIPPSIPMVLYGVTANVSIGAMFLGGIIPGIMIGLSLMIITYFHAKKHHYTKGERSSWSNTWKTFKSSVLAMIMPIIILGGILSGVATPTESAVVAVVYGLVVGLFFYRELKLTDLPRIFFETAKLTAVIMILVGMSQLLGWVLTFENIPQKIVTFFTTLPVHKYMVFFILDFLLIIAGLFLHGPAMIVVLVPIMLPIVTALGMHPVQFGIVFVIAVALGGLTPPVAACTFVVTSLANLTLTRVMNKMIWMLVLVTIIFFMVTYIPFLSMLIPRLFYNMH
jgi:C4-dicarboxylate transporter, DctM subunit